MNDHETVDRLDLESTLRKHTGSRVFARTLNGITSTERLLCVLGRYVCFNSVFGSGVASLSGEIGSRQGLFRDPEEKLTIVADRSVEVAAAIFFAAINEFGIRGHNTHRALAQGTLKATTCFFGYNASELDRIARINDSTQTAINQVLNGYGVGQPMSERKIFHSIGFHIGSEVLADQEFNVLDRFLRTRHRDLVEYLENTEVQIDGVMNTAYDWVYIHTRVEADHLDAALVSANRALRYYAGLENKFRVKDWILNGLIEFATVQTKCMQGLLVQS